MAISEGNVLRLAVVWRLDAADEQVNTFIIRVNETGLIGTDEETRNAISEYLTDLYAGPVQDIVNNLVHNRVEIFNLTLAAPELPIGAIAALNGQDTGVMQPAGVSMLVFGRTGISRVIARKFMPTYSTGALADGQFSAGALGRAADFAEIWEAPWSNANLTELEAGVWRNGTTFVPIAQAVAQPNPAYQRRRRKGRGG